MGDFLEPVRTWTPSRAGGDDFTYVDLSAVDSTTKRIAQPTRVGAAEAPSRARQLIRTGDVLVSTVRPNLNAIAAVPPTLDGATASTGFAVLRPSSGLDERYLFHWVRTPAFVSDMVRKSTGASYPAVSDRIVKDSNIPLPSAKDQRRIGAILDAADAIRSKRKAVLDHLDSLSDALFHQAFGDPLSSSAATPSRPLGSVAQVLTGNSPSRQDPKNFGNDIEWIKSGNLGGRIATRAEEGLSEVGRRRARIAPKGSVLVTCIAGSPTSIGKASIVDRDVAFNQQINAVLPSANLHPEFLLAQLKVAPALVRQKSTGGMKGLVSKSAFETIEILVPAIEAQDAFVRRKSIVDAARAAVQRALSADDELFASLQSRAFSGKL